MGVSACIRLARADPAGPPVRPAPSVPAARGPFFPGTALSGRGVSAFIPFARSDLAAPPVRADPAGVPAARGPFIRGIAVSG